MENLSCYTNLFLVLSTSFQHVHAVSIKCSLHSHPFIQWSKNGAISAIRFLSHQKITHKKSNIGWVNGKHPPRCFYQHHICPNLVILSHISGGKPWENPPFFSTHDVQVPSWSWFPWATSATATAGAVRLAMRVKLRTGRVWVMKID